MGFSQEAVESVGENWAEIAQFNDTLERLRNKKTSVVKPEGPAAISKVVWKIICFQQVILYRIVMLADGCADAWNARNILASILCARALMEAAALVLDFENQLKNFCGEGNFQAIDDLVMNRTFGTKLKDWHEQAAGTVAVNILTVLGKMDKAIEGAAKHYETLSEMCHPNTLGHHLMFGKLEKEKAILHLSDSKCFDEAHFSHIFGAFVLIGLAENSFSRIEQDLLPKVFKLSEEVRSKM